MRLVWCRTSEQVQMAQALRYEVFCLEKRWIDPETCVGGLEVDEYDEIAEHFLVLDETGTKALGTSRLLIGARQHLPSQEYLDFRALGLDPARVVEVSRMAAHRSGRSQDLAVWLGVTKIMWEWSTERLMLAWTSVTDVPLFLLMKRVGMPITAEGERVHHMGSDCIPSVVEMSGTGEVLRRRGFLDDDAA